MFIFKWYSNLLQTHPWSTKCITSGVINSIGDAVNQKYIQCHQSIDFRRSFNMWLIGTVYFGPILTTWYTVSLPKIAKFLYPSAGNFARAMGNMIIDRICFAPLLMTFYYPTYGVIKQNSLSGWINGWKQTKQKLWDTMILNWQIWPLGIFINFWLIPVKYQVLFNNCIRVFWSIALSYLTYK